MIVVLREVPTLAGGGTYLGSGAIYLGVLPPPVLTLTWPGGSRTYLGVSR